MAINWYEAVDIAVLLTSTKQLDRIKGKVYWILKNDINNTKSGDCLFAELAKDLIMQEVYDALCNRFVGTFSNDYITQDVELAAQSIFKEYFENPPTISACMDPFNPTSIKIDVVWPITMNEIIIEVPKV